MTLKERVIVETYTGVCMTSPDERLEVYKYMAQIMGRPVYTHELAEDEIQSELKEKSKPDFLSLCKEESVEDKNHIDSSSFDSKNIIAALKLLQAVCDDHNACGGCPLFNEKTTACALKYELPSLWEINDGTAPWRAFIQ